MGVQFVCVGVHVNLAVQNETRISKIAAIKHLLPSPPCNNEKPLG